MPAACSLSSRLSTRNASMTMSWVAEVAATTSAAIATTSGETENGSHRPSKTIAAMSTICENTSQPRRRPSAPENSGASSASTTGAHKNLSV